MAQNARKVAIACQGGGSHTAFTAGVLSGLFDRFPPGYELVGLSGTSGGAACAALAWYGHLHHDEDVGGLLEAFWRDLSASTPAHRASNALVQWGIHLQRIGVPVPELSPAVSPGSRWAQRELRRALEARIDFEAVPSLLDGSHPALFIGAIDVTSGEFAVFREDALSSDVLLASAAEPHVFEAVEIDGRHYWDGLFAKNPPLADFLTAADVPNPDEIWIIKINPRERPGPPRTLEGIDNRRNELSGNLSMVAEVRFIERVNDWVEMGYLPERYTHTEVRWIPFPGGGDLDWRTKLDRDPRLIRRLFRQGSQEAERFLTA